MKTVIQKWGNSLGMRIPAVYAKHFNLKKGSSVEILEEGGKIVIYPGRITLDDLLSQVNEENKHDAVESGESVGKEEW